MIDPNERIVSIPEAMKILSMGRTQLYKRWKEGDPGFPPRVARGRKIVGVKLSSIMSYIEALPVKPLLPVPVKTQSAQAPARKRIWQRRQP